MTSLQINIASPTRMTSSERVSATSIDATSSDASPTAATCLSCSSPTAKSSTSHLYAQQLNNSAALCIEIGHYSRAIDSLQRALELNRSSENGWKDRDKEVCKCHKCTLDGCISFTENTPLEATTSFSSGNCSNISKKRRKISFRQKNYSSFWKPSSHMQEQQSLAQDSNPSAVYIQKLFPLSRPHSHQQCPDNYHSNESNCGGYIYRRPIRVSCEGHAMGTTLYLIVTFNLALAHHLQAVSDYVDNVEGRKKSISRTLALYELTYKWQLKLLCARDKNKCLNISTSTRKERPLGSSPSSPPFFTAVTSVRFNMIIRNNLSQIHRLVGNHSKHRRCLEHLLSTVMVVMEYKSRSTVNRVVSNSTNDPRHMELDGFFENIMPLILRKDDCANAA